MTKIIVCIKQVSDPEAPSSAYKIDADTNRVVLKGIPPVLSPFDENALEAALRIKDAHQGKITVISMGRRLSKAVLMKSLATGADELFLLEDSAFDEIGSYATAFVLARAIRKLGQYDLIFTGRQAADTNAGIVGSYVAEMLGIPCITVIRKVVLGRNKLIAERVVSNGYEVIEVPLPALLTVSNELGELRYFNAQDFVATRKKLIMTWSAQELGVDPSRIKRTELLKLFIPHEETRCKIIEGESAEELGANLALKLRSVKIL